MIKCARLPIEAIAVLENDGIQGAVIFREILTMDENYTLTQVDIDIVGLKPCTAHGIHIHHCGDLRRDRDWKNSLHYNPYNTQHGNVNELKSKRHVGDLGNVVADEQGAVNVTILDKLIRLSGNNSVIGRCVVIDAMKDDLGRGCNPNSRINGCCDSLMAAGVIGYSDINYTHKL
jgi:Cu/Zn superoxide dismutase